MLRMAAAILDSVIKLSAKKWIAIDRDDGDKYNEQGRTGHNPNLSCVLQI
jgi:hypothetical protein